MASMEVDSAAMGLDRHGLKQYYMTKIEELQLTVSEKNQDLRRLQAQRNELNAKVRSEPGDGDEKQPHHDLPP